MAGTPKYKTAAEMQEAIDRYFVEREGMPITLSGLALHLGFTSRQSLINYRHKNKAFLDTILRAKLRCEDYTESRLYDRDGQRGAEFSLRCNFGWNDKVQEDGDTDKLDAILGAIKGEASKT